MSTDPGFGSDATSFAGGPNRDELAQRAKAHADALAARTAELLNPAPGDGSTAFAAQPVEASADDLSTLTVPKLRDLAESEGVDLTGCKSKSDILTAIGEHRASTTASADEQKEAGS